MIVYRWDVLVAETKRRGVLMSKVNEILLAAAAVVHDLTVVTRNEKGFQIDNLGLIGVLRRFIALVIPRPNVGVLPA